MFTKLFYILLALIILTPIVFLNIWAVNNSYFVKESGGETGTIVLICEIIMIFFIGIGFLSSHWEIIKYKLKELDNKYKKNKDLTKG